MRESSLADLIASLLYELNACKVRWVTIRHNVDDDDDDDDDDNKDCEDENYYCYYYHHDDVGNDNGDYDD